MRPKPASLSDCPCARTVETVGEWWSILILRDALQGFSRFDEFQASLGIAPNMLARRLKHLTQSGCSRSGSIASGPSGMIMS